MNEIHNLRMGKWAMENIILITGALEFIENNLTENIKTDDIAKKLYCSKSTIEKLFRYVTNMSIRDYLIRRRMSKAAIEIAGSADDASLLNLALKYGYNSNEAFTRAFKSVWHITPSEYKKNPARYELFPAFNLESELMEDVNMKGRKKVDISELYDFIKVRKDCYFVGVDIKGLIPINEISREAGDIAILTAMNRLDMAAGEEDIVFRIGGDEFVALTNSCDKEYAENMVKEVLSHNGETFKYGELDIPLSLYATCYKLEKSNIRYSELFVKMQQQLDVAKK